MKSRKSRDSWSNRQILPWSTELRRTKANRVLQREDIDRSKHPLPTTQDSTHGHHQIVNTKSRLQPKMEKLPTVSRNKTGS